MILSDVITWPVGGVAVIVNVVVEPTVGFVGAAVIATVGRAGWPTTIDAAAEVASPNESVAVARTMNEPGLLKVCDTLVGAPLNVCAGVPSPQSTTTRATGVVVEPVAPYARVKSAVCPAVTAAVGAVIVSAGGALTVTVKLALCALDVGPVLPVPPDAAPPPPRLPALAVTLAVLFVVRVD